MNTPNHRNDDIPTIYATKNQEIQMNEKLLVPAVEAAKMLSMGRSTFWNKVKLKQLPQPVKIAGITRWRVSDLRTFVNVGSHRDTPV
ncbi:hypothetical protein [Variovorax paradoxus]|uniref:helix-turn-helix transcriptional regulator n=1 Tax=Variovorax paradoxus TaxID=34073 RepID=UPI0030D3159C